jgi:DNA-3-methyladenine glycosylase II
MWFPPADEDGRWAEAIAHLRTDKTMARIIDRVGPCLIRPRRDYFVKLVQSIFSQQVSVAAASAMYAKLKARVRGQQVTPQSVLEFLTTQDDETIRSTGLSRQKRGYMHDLARRFADGAVPYKRFAKMSDEEIIESLTQVKGIGRWTVEMLLIFALNRPDVWPVDDLGLREHAFRNYPRLFKERPTAKDPKLAKLGERFAPYRSVATWYLWRSSAK